ncbi:hypothetical protein GYMLUDRAFT_235888 [Collybiopsis luxurians FD-317 M1]|nr:hypothetical protein GYMLUDRAFT_235888 [Collybiopsis luxurians FD-317 M1]
MNVPGDLMYDAYAPSAFVSEDHSTVAPSQIFAPVGRKPISVNAALKSKFIDAYKFSGTHKSRRELNNRYRDLKCTECIRKRIPCEPKDLSFLCKACRPTHCSRKDFLQKLRITSELKITDDVYDWLNNWHSSKGLKTRAGRLNHWDSDEDDNSGHKHNSIEPVDAPADITVGNSSVGDNAFAVGKGFDFSSGVANAEGSSVPSVSNIYDSDSKHPDSSTNKSVGIERHTEACSSPTSSPSYIYDNAPVEQLQVPLPFADELYANAQQPVSAGWNTEVTYGSYRPTSDSLSGVGVDSSDIALQNLFLQIDPEHGLFDRSFEPWQGSVIGGALSEVQPNNEHETTRNYPDVTMYQA